MANFQTQSPGIAELSRRGGDTAPYLPMCIPFLGPEHTAPYLLMSGLARITTRPISFRVTGLGMRSAIGRESF
jgi:hypothetical protein